MGMSFFVFTILYLLLCVILFYPSNALSKSEESKVVFVFLKNICAGSYVYVAQTTRRHCHLQTVCFFEDISLKTSVRALIGAHLAQPLLRSSKVCKGLNTTTTIHYRPPHTTVHHHFHHLPPPTTVHHHRRYTTTSLF
ncbi:hypothetical protein Hanom_Chr02g00177211 [Helianthus anomalus]